MLVGVWEALRLLQSQLRPLDDGSPRAPDCLRVETLLEGDDIAPHETVMLIHAPYRCVAHLETAVLGVLARRSLVASNVRRVIRAPADAR